MTYSQRKEELLKTQIIPQTKEDDFESFWLQQVEAMRAHPLRIERHQPDLPYKTFKAYEIVFNAHDDTPVTAYFCIPNTYTGTKLPCAALYHGGGIMTHGLLDKNNCYMKNLYLDAVRAVDVIASLPEVDAYRIPEENYHLSVHSAHRVTRVQVLSPAGAVRALIGTFPNFRIMLQ